MKNIKFLVYIIIIIEDNLNHKNSLFLYSKRHIPLRKIDFFVIFGE